MSSFLDKILTSKRIEIAKCKNHISQSEIERIAAARTGFRGFEDSLNQDGVRIISEIKRASPSRGDINPDLNPATVAQAYQEGGAAALSVLTEPNFFKGTQEDLKSARAAIELPVLRKDFIIEPYQVYESAAIGADAILLIVRILDDAMLCNLYSLARRLGLDVLTEVFDEEDAKRAAALKATMIGINNRDLAHFKTDINHAVRIAKLLPESASVVAASGVHNKADIELNLNNGIRRFLIGEALVKQPDPVATLKIWIATD
ncbi:MAG: indole-3-glycerol phosphate synthase TrpC [Kiritimatiellae bacterium]|jgi:indole-3-glycerol phosphate synthase|nr:indole-3-glycerol phosphate synthase TrpC [Kiritimatiellia bacterium]